MTEARRKHNALGIYLGRPSLLVPVHITLPKQKWARIPFAPPITVFGQGGANIRGKRLRRCERNVSPDDQGTVSCSRYSTVQNRANKVCVAGKTAWLRVDREYLRRRLSVVLPHRLSSTLISRYKCTRSPRSPQRAVGLDFHIFPSVSVPSSVIFVVPP